MSLRTLLARIAKEFDFPRVVAVRCRMEVRVRPLRAPCPMSVRTLSLPRVTVADLTTRFQPTCRSAVLPDTDCRSVTPLSGITAEVATVSCFDGDAPVTVCAPEVRIPEPARVAPTFRIAETAVRGLPFDAEPPAVASTSLIGAARTRGGPMLARTMPFHLAVTPMSDLNMRLVIRFRAAVLKQLNLSPTKLKYIGVVRNLPKAPLSVLKYEPGIEPGTDRVRVRLRGAANPHFGRRAWVFVQIQGKYDYLPVTVKEEDA